MEHLPTDTDRPLCESARAELGRLVETALVPEQGSSLRRHLELCAACEHEYRESLRVTARIARERRLGRESAERRRRREERLRLARSPRSHRPYSMIVRTLVLPGLLIFLLTRMSESEVEARARALVGEYSLGVRRMDTQDVPQPLRRGDWIVTGTESAASLTLGARNEVLVERDSKVCVEDRGLGRLLFDSGALVVRGRRTITTGVGVLELEHGELRIHGDSRCVTVELRAGACVVCDALGERRLEPGERLSLGRASDEAAAPRVAPHAR